MVLVALAVVLLVCCAVALTVKVIPRRSWSGSRFEPFDDGDEGDDGAGVREPRRPLPTSGAAAATARKPG